MVIYSDHWDHVFPCLNGKVTSLLSLPHSVAFLATCQGLSVQNIELYTLHKFKITHFFLQTQHFFYDCSYSISFWKDLKPYYMYLSLKKKNRCTGFIQVHENLERPGILLWHFPGLESPGKRLLVLESSGNLLNSSEKHEMYGRQ